MAKGYRTAAPWNFEDVVLGDAGTLGPAQLERKPYGLPRVAALAFSNMGLVCVERTASANAALGRAGAIIGCVPGLSSIVDRRVECITIVRSAGECFDTSHSDPVWPGIVLVSIPPQGPVGDLRLAEGIIHEAMHHHLSALEANVTLVRGQRLLHSPWRDTLRPAGGVLHGLFVFACVAHALQKLIDLDSLGEDALRHARKRIGEIRGEINMIDHGGLRTALTARGRAVQTAACRAVEHCSPELTQCG